MLVLPYLGRRLDDRLVPDDLLDDLLLDRIPLDDLLDDDRVPKLLDDLLDDLLLLRLLDDLRLEPLLTPELLRLLPELTPLLLLEDDRSLLYIGADGLVVVVPTDPPLVFPLSVRVRVVLVFLAPSLTVPDVLDPTRPLVPARFDNVPLLLPVTVDPVVLLPRYVPLALPPLLTALLLPIVVTRLPTQPPTGHP